MTDTHEPTGYDGPAEVLAGDSSLEVTVTLRGAFQPIDGHYHWYGRLDPDPTLAELGRAGATVDLRTPHGRAEGRLSDEDPWGRYRIDGMGRPPFPIED